MRRPLENCLYALALPYRISPKELTLQPLQLLIPQSVLRQHPPHRLLQHLPTPPLPHHALEVDLLETARPRRVPVVLLLLQLLSRHVQVRAAGGDNVVAAVGAGIPDRLVLAHEDDGDAGGQAAERGGGGRGEGDVVPGSGIGEAGLWDVLGRQEKGGMEGRGGGRKYTADGLGHFGWSFVTGALGARSYGWLCG